VRANRAPTHTCAYASRDRAPTHTCAYASRDRAPTHTCAYGTSRAACAGGPSGRVRANRAPTHTCAYASRDRAPTHTRARTRAGTVRRRTRARTQSDYLWSYGHMCHCVRLSRHGHAVTCPRSTVWLIKPYAGTSPVTNPTLCRALVLRRVKRHVLRVIHLALHKVGDALVAPRELACDVELVGMLRDGDCYLERAMADLPE